MAQLSYIPTTKLAGLLAKAEKSGHAYVSVRSKNLLTVGADPLSPTHVIDLTREVLRSLSDVDIAPEPKAEPKPRARRAARRSGEYLIEIKGKTIECMSLRELLAEGLKALEKHQSGTLTKLSAVRPRSKRIVARDPNLLFRKTELAEKYAAQLTNGWWYGTNNSAEEVLTWLRRGAEFAGLEWDKDILAVLK